MKEPYFVTKIDKTKMPQSNRIILGDLNGDGVLEMVLLQADSGIDDRYIPHMITCLTAIDIRGNILWQAGTPMDEIGGTGSDFPAQIYDIDGDGENEVICVMDKRFKVFAGKTGELKAEYELPHEYAHDCIILANLSGEDKPKNVILKDRYRKMWAMNHDFTVMWTHEGNLGHFPYPYDVNGDGYDEIMAGYDMLDRFGNVLWSVQMDEHADCIFVSDMYQDASRGVQVIIGGGITGVYDANGVELCSYDGAVETQHVAVGKFRNDIAGRQIACLDRIVRGGPSARDAMFLLDNNAKLVWKEDRTTVGWLTILETIQNWDDSGMDYILAYRRGGGIMPTIYDGHMNVVTAFPVDGYVLHASIFNDGYEDVIIFNKDEIYVYSSVDRDLDNLHVKAPVVQPKRLYMATLYPGDEIL